MHPDSRMMSKESLHAFARCETGIQHAVRRRLKTELQESLDDIDTFWLRMSVGGFVVP
jgi:hypothetical protein